MLSKKMEHMTAIKQNKYNRLFKTEIQIKKRKLQ